MCVFFLTKLHPFSLTRGENKKRFFWAYLLYKMYATGMQYCICNYQFIQIENGFDPRLSQVNHIRYLLEITGAGKSVERAGNSGRRQGGKRPPSQVAAGAQRGQVRLRARLGLGLA